LAHPAPLVITKKIPVHREVQPGESFNFLFAPSLFGWRLPRNPNCEPESEFSKTIAGRIQDFCPRSMFLPSLPLAPPLSPPVPGPSQLAFWCPVFLFPLCLFLFCFDPPIDCPGHYYLNYGIPVGFSLILSPPFRNLLVTSTLHVVYRPLCFLNPNDLLTLFILSHFPLYCPPIENPTLRSLNFLCSLLGPFLLVPVWVGFFLSSALFFCGESLSSLSRPLNPCA